MPKSSTSAVPAQRTPPWAAELSARERRFVEEYLIDLNGTEAAIRAGLGKTRKSSTEIASRLRRKQCVARAIATLMNERAAITGGRIIEELARVGFAKITDFVKVEGGKLVVADTSKLSEDQQAAISEISETVSEHGRTIRVKLHEKLTALDRMAKILNMYRERVEVSGPDGGPVEINDVRARIAERLAKMRKALEIESAPTLEIEPPVKRLESPPHQGRMPEQN